MNKKLIYRMLGAIGAALIIVGVFVPFVNINGFTTSLWDTYKADSIYLPITLIVFGAMGVIFFSLNLKTEFAYMSSGAVAFFIVMQTIEMSNQGFFSSLSIGYYCLIVGAVLVAFIAFLNNLKPRVKATTSSSDISNQPNVLNKIDMLYNPQPVNNTNVPIQEVQKTVQPLEQSVQQNNLVQPIPVQDLKPNSESANLSVQIQEPVQPVGLEPIPDMAKQEQPIVSNANPVIQEFSNNVNTETNISAQPIPQVQPQPVVNNLSDAQSSNVQKVNPVLQEFANPVEPFPQQNVNLNETGQNVQQVNSNVSEFIQPQPVQNDVQSTTPEQNQQVGMDIFGQ